ncbi:MAG: hypothetical protein GY854_10665 [Deltaproteobacteria bacterium]|nr:hypothetical protein [Deltaproteobacteria bacterium]
MHTRKIVILLLGAVLGVAAFIFGLHNDETRNTSPDSKRSESFERGAVRHTSAELSERMAALRKNRNGLPAEIALERAETDEQREFLKKQLELQTRTPAQALTQARSKLEETEHELAKTTDPKERERLLRHKRLIEKIIAKLGQM